MTQSFDNPKDLRFVIALGTGSFGSSNMNTITLQGFRASVSIDKAGGPVMGTLNAQIYGVSQSDMNSIVTVNGRSIQGQGTILTTPADVAYHATTVQVFAIDGDTETLVYTGNVINAWGNYQSMPDVFLQIQAMSNAVDGLKPIAPTSYNGAVDVATAMSQVADAMSLTFENNGVSGNLLSNQYLPGTLLDQARTIVKAAGIWMYIDNGTLAISPAGQSRSGQVPLISASTGMVGYPTFDGVGVNFQVLFNPAIKFGGSIEVQSDILQASGVWIVASMGLKLESQKPRGAWFMTIRGNKSGLAITSV